MKENVLHKVEWAGRWPKHGPTGPGCYVWLSFLAGEQVRSVTPRTGMAGENLGHSVLPNFASPPGDIFKAPLISGQHQSQLQQAADSSLQQAALRSHNMMNIQVLLVAVAIVGVSAQQFGGIGGGLGGGYHGQSGRSYAVFSGPVEGHVQPIRGTVADQHGKHVEFEDYIAYPKYKYEYGVEDHHTGDFKQQSEIRDGDQVQGQYSFKEPDGNIRTVKYVVDKHSGFQAVVLNSKH